jgi:ABC-type enterobactin transport system permease subunit
MQTTLNNSLASPFTLGLSSAATFGAALAIILGIGIPGVPQTWIVSANAFALAFATAMLLQLLARLRGSGGETLVLFGIALFFTFNALIAIMQFIASEQALQQLVFWTLGSLTRSNQEKIWILLVVIACILPLSFASSWQLTGCALAPIAHAVSASTLCGCASSRSCGSAFSPARPSRSSGRLPSSAWSARISPACWSERTTDFFCLAARWRAPS